MDDERVSTSTLPKNPPTTLPNLTVSVPTAIIATAGSKPYVAPTQIPTPLPIPAFTPTSVLLTPASKASTVLTKTISITNSGTISGTAGVLATPTTDKPEDTAATIATVLNKQAETRASAMPQNLELIKNKLKTLLQEMKVAGPDENIGVADLSAEGNLDIVATFEKNWSQSAGGTYSPGYLLVLHQVSGMWNPLVYRKPMENNVQNDFSHPTLIGVSNLNKSRYPQIIFSEIHCSSSNCTTFVRLLSWYNKKWVDLTPVVPEMENLEHIGFENRDNDGTLALAISGGVTKALDAGPQRQRTEIYRYSKASDSFNLSETTYQASDYQYFRILDGNSALLKHKYDDAIAYYIDAAYNDKLKSWAKEQGESFDAVMNEHTALVSYARFRLGITYLLKGDRQKASDIFNVALNHDGDYKLWTQAFIAPYQDHPATATVAEGCSAATKLSLLHPELIQPLNKFGYANPLFKPEDICPAL